MRRALEPTRPRRRDSSPPNPSCSDVGRGKSLRKCEHGAAQSDAERSGSSEPSQCDATADDGLEVSRDAGLETEFSRDGESSRRVPKALKAPASSLRALRDERRLAKASRAPPRFIADEVAFASFGSIPQQRVAQVLGLISPRPPADAHVDPPPQILRFRAA